MLEVYLCKGIQDIVSKPVHNRNSLVQSEWTHDWNHKTTFDFSKILGYPFKEDITHKIKISTTCLNLLSFSSLGTMAGSCQSLLKLTFRGIAEEPIPRLKLQKMNRKWYKQSNRDHTSSVWKWRDKRCF